jgi:integrase
MASLHKDPLGRSPYWYCAFTLPDGQRRFRSTKQRDRKEALKVCLGWEKASEAAARGELTQVQARKVLDEILENIGESPIVKTTAEEFFATWLNGKKLSLSARAFERYRKVVHELRSSLGERVHRPISALSPADITSFRDHRLAQGVSGSTVKGDLSVVRSILGVARRQGMTLHNPAEAVDLPKSRSREREVFAHHEVADLVRAASADWKTVILIGYYAGPRLGDIVSLTWANVDLASGVLFYRQSKTERKVEVPLHPELQEHLENIAGDDPKRPLCGSLSRVRVSGKSGLSKQFAAVMAKAGIDQEQVQSSAKRKFSALSFHSLRHSFASALTAANVSADVRMKLTGHQSIDVHQRYTHVQLEPLRKAIGALPRLG